MQIHDLILGCQNKEKKKHKEHQHYSKFSCQLAKVTFILLTYYTLIFVQQGCLRVLLVLLHDFPEFLCDYHYGFCDVIPPNCIQMRNLILSAFPRNMRLPDPFTPNLKVDMLADITQPPRILTNFAAMIQPASFKKVSWSNKGFRVWDVLSVCRKQSRFGKIWSWKQYLYFNVHGLFRFLLQCYGPLQINSAPHPPPLTRHVHRGLLWLEKEIQDPIPADCLT